MCIRETPVPIPNTTVKTYAADGTMLETAWESRWLPDYKKENGGVAQLGEHLPCKQGVKSSNLSVSIVKFLRNFTLEIFERKTNRLEIATLGNQRSKVTRFIKVNQITSEPYTWLS